MVGFTLVNGDLKLSVWMSNVILNENVNTITCIQNPASPTTTLS